MDVQKDFSDLCSLLNARRIDFLIIGGYAVAFHGAPRFTGDLDILIRPTLDHVERLLDALRDFGFPSQHVSAADVLNQNAILQLGRVPVQIHIMTRITAVDWDEAWNSKVPSAYGDVAVYFIGRSALISNKRAAGRLKDLADIEALGERP